MRLPLLLFLILIAYSLSAQFAIPAYNIVKDSATHTTVFHSGNAEKIKLSNRRYTDTLELISPDIKIKTGMVDHKGLTGEMLVREYYIDSTLIGYIEYDGRDMQRELYFNSTGQVFLETRYDKGSLISTESKRRIFYIKRPE